MTSIVYILLLVSNQNCCCLLLFWFFLHLDLQARDIFFYLKDLSSHRLLQKELLVFINVLLFPPAQRMVLLLDRCPLDEKIWLSA